MMKACVFVCAMILCAMAGHASAADACAECWHYVMEGCPYDCDPILGGSFFIDGHFVFIDPVYVRSYDTGWYRECTADDAEDTDLCSPDQTWYVCEAHDAYATKQDCEDGVNAISFGWSWVDGPQVGESTKCAWEEIVIQ
jgi:hypothetical protein